MKTKLLVLMLLTGSALFARTRVSIGIGIGVPGYGYGYYPPPPVVVYQPPCPGPDYYWVDGYWYSAGPRHYWREGYWEPPAYRSYRAYPGYYRESPRYYGRPKYRGSKHRKWDRD